VIFNSSHEVSHTRKWLIAPVSISPDIHWSMVSLNHFRSAASLSQYLHVIFLKLK
jgi:hypothetical protein